MQGETVTSSQFPCCTIEMGKEPLKREYFADMERVRDRGILPLPVAVLPGRIPKWYSYA